MKAAAAPRSDVLAERLLVVDPERATVAHRHIADLPASLGAGDVLVLNDAFTWPASLSAVTSRGVRVELRLAAELEPGTFRAIALGEGDHHVPTEARGEPPLLAVGERLLLERGGGEVEVVETEPAEPRWLAVRFMAPADVVTERILRAGRPVQYAHVAAPLALWDVQTPFAARPMAFEMPSAGRPLVPSLLAQVRARGCAVVTLSHAAGLSSTGRTSLDARLPLPERYVIPPETALAVRRAREVGGRVVAAGTTVVRALEAAAGASGDGLPAGGEGVAALRIGPTTPLAVVDGILTGVHEPGTSHFELLRAFASGPVLDRALAAAEAEGYLLHELGDSMLILEGRPRSVTTRSFSGTVAACPRPGETTRSAPPS